MRPGFRKRGMGGAARMPARGYQGPLTAFLECRKFWTPPTASEGWLAFWGRNLALFTYFNELRLKEEIVAGP